MTSKPKAGKRPYGRPQLRKVPLVPEEAVLAACKVPRGGCNPPGHPPSRLPGS